MSKLVDCASGTSTARHAQIRKEAQETLLGDAINGVQFDVCDVIGDPDLAPGFALI